MTTSSISLNAMAGSRAPEGMYSLAFIRQWPRAFKVTHHGAHATQREALQVGHIMCNLLRGAAEVGAITDEDVARVHKTAARARVRHEHLKRVLGWR
jgi:hypothetical protein